MRKRLSISQMCRPLLLASLVLTVACGSDDDSSTSIVVNPDDQQREEAEGPITTRRTVVINNKIITNVVMNVRNTTKIEGDNYFLDWECGNVDPVEHKQYIHIASRCPTIDDDLNRDGIVDALEVEQAVGPGVLALDSNPETQEVEAFPIGSDYEYSSSIPLPVLRQIIPVGQDFVVIMYGIDPSTPLPETVANNTDNEIHSTIPVACKVFEAPDVVDGTTGDTTGGTTNGGTTTGGTTNGGTTNGDTTNGGTTNGGTTNGGTTNGGTTNGGTTNGSTTNGTT